MKCRDDFGELFKDLPKIFNKPPLMKIAEYRFDMFIRCPDGTLHEWDKILYPLPYPRQGTCQVCLKCGEIKGHDSGD